MDVQTSKTIPLDPGDWPQDNLRVPQIYGQTRIEQINYQKTKRDPYALTGNLTVAQNATGMLSIEVGNAGDFWCTSLSILTPFVATYYNLQGWGRLTMIDNRTGYQFFRPYTWVNLFNPIAQAGIVGETTPNFQDQVFNPGPRSALPSPHLFARGSAIQLSISRPTLGAEPVDPVAFYICLDGWLEYENAS